DPVTAVVIRPRDGTPLARFSPCLVGRRARLWAEDVEVDGGAVLRHSSGPEGSATIDGSAVPGGTGGFDTVAVLHLRERYRARDRVLARRRRHPARQRD